MSLTAPEIARMELRKDFSCLLGVRPDVLLAYLHGTIDLFEFNENSSHGAPSLVSYKRNTRTRVAVLPVDLFTTNPASWTPGTNTASTVYTCAKRILLPKTTHRILGILTRPLCTNTYGRIILRGYDSTTFNTHSHFSVWWRMLDAVTRGREAVIRLNFFGLPNVREVLICDVVCPMKSVATLCRIRWKNLWSFGARLVSKCPVLRKIRGNSAI